MLRATRTPTIGRPGATGIARAMAHERRLMSTPKVAKPKRTGKARAPAWKALTAAEQKAAVIGAQRAIHVDCAKHRIPESIKFDLSQKAIEKAIEKWEGRKGASFVTYTVKAAQRLWQDMQRRSSREFSDEPPEVSATDGGDQTTEAIAIHVEQSRNWGSALLDEFVHARAGVRDAWGSPERDNAQAQLRVVARRIIESKPALEQWLERDPEFRVDPEKPYPEKRSAVEKAISAALASVPRKPESDSAQWRLWHDQASVLLRVGMNPAEVVEAIARDVAGDLGKTLTPQVVAAAAKKIRPLGHNDNEPVDSDKVATLVVREILRAAGEDLHGRWEQGHRQQEYAAAHRRAYRPGRRGGGQKFKDEDDWAAQVLEELGLPMPQKPG